MKMLAGERADSSNEQVVRTRNKVILNVGGIRHETYVGTLKNIPDTRLNSLTNNNPTQVPEFDPSSGEFFFDRHPLVFAQILNYYRTGKLHCPNDVCGPVFEEELAFWGLEDASIETCCWMNYKKHGEAQANLSSFDKIEEEAASEHEYSFHEEGDVGIQMRSYRQVLRKYKSRIWVTLEEPSSSLTAKIIAMLSMVLIIASVITSCLETVEYFSRPHSTQHAVIHTIEVVCVVWFTAEIFIRFIVCPSKRKFIKQIMNWLDFAAIIPFYVQQFLANTELNSIVVIRIIRLIRVFRVFKLSRHSYSLQILGHTLRSSLSELFLLGFFLSIGVVVFSTLMFYAEHESKNKKFSSIPAGFWWAVVTMTTIGYGDIVPDTIPGKLVGAACAICGVLTIALPIPVIVSNFSLYYSHAKAKQKASQRKRPLVIGAANALKVIDPFVGSRATNIRLSTMSENASYMSPCSHVRNWSKIALEMAGSSFDSSEPSLSPTGRRRMSKLPDKLWQLHGVDEARNLTNFKNQSSAPKITDEISTSGKNSEDCTKCFDIVTNELEIQNRMRTTSNAVEEPFQDLARGFDLSETKNCGGAYDNEAIEQNSEIDLHPSIQFDEDAELASDKDNIAHGVQYYRHHNTLPKIQIIRNSSASQMSGSNSSGIEQLSNDETSGKSRWKSGKRKTKKKSRRPHLAVEKTTSAPALSATTGEKTLPSGRMGRRGSVFVVGFLGKRWQAKTAKARQNRMQAKSKPDIKLAPFQDKSHLDLLQVSPSLSSHRSTPNEETSRQTSTTSFATPSSSISSRSGVFRFSLPFHQSVTDSRFFRRSSCPTLQTSNLPEIAGNTIDLNHRKNVGTALDEEGECFAKPADINEEVDKGNVSLEEFRSNAKLSGQDTLNTKQSEIDTMSYDVNTKHTEVDINRKKLDMNQNEADTAHSEREYESSHTNTKVTKIQENWSKLIRTQNSISSTQSDSSLKAELDGKVCRTSSPLIRQRALRFSQGQDVGQLDDSDDEEQGSLQNCFTIDSSSDSSSEQTSERNCHSDAREPTYNQIQVGSELVRIGCSTLSFTEIGKNRSSSSKHSATDEIGKHGLRTYKNENTKQANIENTLNGTDQTSTDVSYTTTTCSQYNNEEAMDFKTTSELKSGFNKNVAIKKTTSHKKSKNKTEPIKGKHCDKWNGNLGVDKKQGPVKSHNSVTAESLNESENSLNSSCSNNSTIECTRDRNFPKVESTSENNNTSVGSNELQDKGLMNGSIPEYNSLNEYQSNSITFKANSSKKDLAIEHKHEEKEEDIYSHPIDSISAKDLDSDHYDDHTEINKNYPHMNNNSTQNEQNHGLDEQTSGNQKPASVLKYESRYLDCDNQTRNSVNVKRNLTNNSSQNERNQESNFQSVNENQNLWRKYVDCHPSIYCRNSTYTERKHSSLGTSISSQTSVDQPTGTQRKVEAQDSGIYCSDYRSSIDSISSFTDRNSDREILNTISEVEHDYDYRDGMLLFQSFPGHYYEKSRSHVLEIRDETAV